MAYFKCPYLNSDVELTDERKKHIAQQHPDLLPEFRHAIEETLEDPDEIRRSSRFTGARLFNRWFETVRDGKYVVVIVVSDAEPSERHWIIIAYMARKLSKGREVEWKRS